jgi:hypothetical protein
MCICIRGNTFAPVSTILPLYIAAVLSNKNAQVILLTEVLTMTKKNIWLITSHSSHHWIFYLARNMITFLVYIEYQNFTRIRIEEIILQVLIFFAESNCGNNSKLHNSLVYVLLSMCNVSYHFEDHRVLHDNLKRLYTFPRWTVSKV